MTRSEIYSQRQHEANRRRESRMIQFALQAPVLSEATSQVGSDLEAYRVANVERLAAEDRTRGAQ